MAVLSDIEIAQAHEMKNITEIAANAAAGHDRQREHERAHEQKADKAGKGVG